MTEAQIVNRACARFGLYDESFKSRVKAEIIPSCEDVLLYDDWAFRKIEGKFWDFTAGQNEKVLPADLHHLTALYRLDQDKPIEWCSDEQWMELNRLTSFAASTPKLRAVLLVKDETQGGNLLKLRFGPPAAGGERVYYNYAQTPSVTSLANVPAFLHEAVCLKVIAEVSPTVVAADAVKSVVSQTYEQNIRRYERKIKELWLRFSDVPVAPMKVDFDEGVKAFKRAQRGVIGV